MPVLFSVRASRSYRGHVGPVLVAVLASLVCAGNLQIAEAGGSPLPGYLGPGELEARIWALDGKAGAKVQSLGQTARGRAVLCIDFGAANRPAIVLMGSVDASRPCCAEIALRVAEQLCVMAGTDSEVDALLSSARLRIIPSPSPDAHAALFAQPFSGSPRNVRPSDEDKDGTEDEDGPDDLDGDGWITSLRIKDGGSLMPHPLDHRVLIVADRAKGETGGWSVYTEGKDNDNDDAVNEDGPGGVDFNRNWTFQYPYFAADAGPHQLSEPESRAVANALFADPSVAIVLTLGPDANLAPLWQTNSGAEGREVKTTLLSADAPYFNFVSELLRECLKVEEAPAAPSGEGSFVKWAYFHYGRLSFGVNPWWPPKPVPVEAQAELKAASQGRASATSEHSAGRDSPVADSGDSEAAGDTVEDLPGESSWDEKDKRGQTDRDLLAWYEQNGIEGFAPWQRIDHPDYPGMEVEVGGFRPLLHSNPPAAELDGLAERQLGFITQLAALLPKLEVFQAQVEALGEGVYRLKARFANSGELPTMSAMGDLSRIPYPMQVTLTLPAGASLLAGRQRQQYGRLEGGDVGPELSWLVLAPQGGQVLVEIASPMAGQGSATIQLEASDG